MCYRCATYMLKFRSTEQSDNTDESVKELEVYGLYFVDWFLLLNV